MWALAATRTGEQRARSVEEIDREHAPLGIGHDRPGAVDFEIARGHFLALLVVIPAALARNSASLICENGDIDTEQRGGDRNESVSPTSMRWHRYTTTSVRIWS